jgi:hypothetical protein
MNEDLTLKNIGNLIERIIGLRKIRHVLIGEENIVSVKSSLDIVFLSAFF